MPVRSLLAAIVGSLLVCSPSFAHVSADHAGNAFTAGWLHPWFGVDHLLVMLAVGMVALRLGGANTWRLPLVFLGGMASGLLVGLSHPAMHVVEAAIIGSMLLLGGLLMLSTLPRTLAMVLGCAVIAFFHGIAHGSELPVAASPLSYAVGCLLATSVLLSIGLLMASPLSDHAPSKWVWRAAGAAIALVGVSMLV